MSDVLQEAQEVVAGARQESYGDPVMVQGRVGAAWGALLGCEALPASTVANMMVALKLVREEAGPGHHRDNLVDAAGYLAISERAALEEYPQPDSGFDGTLEDFDRVFEREMVEPLRRAMSQPSIFHAPADPHGPFALEDDEGLGDRDMGSGYDASDGAFVRAMRADVEAAHADARREEERQFFGSIHPLEAAVDAACERELNRALGLDPLSPGDRQELGAWRLKGRVDREEARLGRPLSLDEHAALLDSDEAEEAISRHAGDCASEEEARARRRRFRVVTDPALPRSAVYLFGVGQGDER